MERQGKFDQEIRNKMLPLEEEPSAAVWAGIRSEIGPAMPSGSGESWVFKLMAAASVVFLIGLAVLLVQRNRPGTTELADQKGQEMPAPAHVPQIEKKNYAEESRPEDDFRQPQPQPWYGPAYPVEKEQLAADEQENTPRMDPQPRQDPPVQQLVEEVPQLRKDPQQIPAPQPIEPKKEELFTDNTAPKEQNRQGNKLNLRLPKTDDLSMENLKEKSRGLLGSLASGARDYLGIDTRYEQEVNNDLRTTAFSANLGLFKVKKVQTVKTKNP